MDLSYGIICRRINTKKSALRLFSISMTCTSSEQYIINSTPLQGIILDPGLRLAA